MWEQILDLALNICSKNNKLFYICYMVIFVAERTLYINEDKEHIIEYLCTILSENAVFQQPDFWEKLIDENIKMLTDKSVNIEKAKKEKEKESEASGGVMSSLKKLFR